MTNSLDHFFSLRVASKRGCIHADSKEEFEAWQVARADGDPVTLLHYLPQSGTKPCDFVGTTYASIVLISSRVRLLLSDHGMTGWRTCPVELRDRQKQIVPDYHLLQVSGRCGPRDKSKSERVFEVPGTEHGRPLKGLPPSWSWKGYYFDPETWDRSDVFMPEGTTRTIVTRRVKELFERERVTNVKFMPLAEVRTSEADADPDWKPPPARVLPQNIYTEEDDRASASVKDAILDIAGGSFEGQSVAVLFARFGDIGFEVLRRGAKHVTMIEQVSERADVIRREARESGWESRVTVAEIEPLSALATLPGGVPSGTDTIIIHPPWKFFEYEEYMGLGYILGLRARLADQGTVILITPPFPLDKPPRFFQHPGFDLESYEWPCTTPCWVHLYNKRPYLASE